MPFAPRGIPGLAGLAAATGVGPDGRTRIYAIGGYNGFIDSLPPHEDNHFSSAIVQAYDPLTDTWTEMAPLPTALYGLTAATGPDGKIYVFGGNYRTEIQTDRGINVIVNTVEVYDPLTNTWTTAPPLPSARANLASAAGQDGRIYVLGGQDVSLGTGIVGALNVAEAYQV